jgi:TusA-related sulfurtransferase
MAEPKYIDFKGLSCPLPLLKLKLAMKEQDYSGSWVIEATDVGATRDIPTYISSLGGDVVVDTVGNGESRFYRLTISCKA